MSELLTRSAAPLSRAALEFGREFASTELGNHDGIRGALFIMMANLYAMHDVLGSRRCGGGASRNGAGARHDADSRARRLPRENLCIVHKN
jgi:hypothetical protein